MSLNHTIYKLRTEAGLSQAKFAEKFGVSHQSVQKWESGDSKPDLDKLVKIAKTFGVSVDYLLFETDKRTEEELTAQKKLAPSYDQMNTWELYSEVLKTEFRQSVEEGLDIVKYEDLFMSVHKLERSVYKSAIADVLFEIVRDAGTVEGYAYDEPSELHAIRARRVPKDRTKKPIDKARLREKLAGAWYGRISGCLLGKPIEGIRLHELIPLLRETGNYPLHRYILNTDITEEMIERYKFPLAQRCYADTIDNAPADDDTNYTVLYQKIIDDYGRDFTPDNIASAWLYYQPKNAYCTAERVAFCNFVKGYRPPDSAVYKNAYREWIGAQIRADYFGYINPGDPETAAEMAWKDACISHTKNGIYGEMFVAAMLAEAAVSEDILEIIEAGLAEIPLRSRLHAAVTGILDGYKNGVTARECFDSIHTRWNDVSGHDWCHTISNAEIVTASLLYGGNDYGRSICMAVEAGFDTDCNGATVGSIIGMKNGIASIGEEWTAPLNGKLQTSIFGVNVVGIEDLIDNTVQHIEKAF